MKDKRLTLGFKVTKQPASIFKTPTDLISTEQELKSCPFCKTKLEQYHAFIPMDLEKNAIVPGLWCRKCDKLFVEDYGVAFRLLKDNPLAKKHTLNNEALWDYTQQKKRRKAEEKRLKNRKEEFEKRKERLKRRIEKLSSISSSEVMIRARFDNKTTKDFIIVSNAGSCVSDEIYHYSSEIGRELLSAAYAEQRYKHGTLNEERYQVIDCIYPCSNGKMPECIVPTALNIRPNGGYSSSIKNAQSEIVDTLLYSLATNRYEILRATLNKISGECYVDIGLYRKYVKTFGRPNLSPTFGNHFSGGKRDFDNLNSESILKGFGYTVNKADRLGTTDRWKILEEIVDLEILTVKQVVSLLDFFIQTHSGSNYIEARSKWRQDKNHIQEYRVNPQRFLIVKF